MLVVFEHNAGLGTLTLVRVFEAMGDAADPLVEPVCRTSSSPQNGLDIPIVVYPQKVRLA